MTVFQGGNPSVEGSETRNGRSPFFATVRAAAVDAASTTAIDSPGVVEAQGLRTGVYNRTAAFVVESRDRFGNRVLEGPVPERQVITVTAPGGHLGGAFTVAFRGEKVTVPAHAGVADLEQLLETLPTVGAVTVTSTPAREPLPLSAGATLTSNLLTPSQDPINFLSIGDWLRVGESLDDSYLFTVKDIRSDCAGGGRRISWPVL